MRNPPRKTKFPWESWDNESLLDLRLCDLGLKQPGELIESCARQLEAELKQKGLRFRPKIWLSDDWFTPEGVPGFAVPFYLAHPRLLQLELDSLGEAEGSAPEDCLKIIRHEAGHAIEHAHELRRIPERRQVFGKSSEPYPEVYAPKPFSRKFVRNLEKGYAQSHPDEDFAETFAVWLAPNSRWEIKYAGWPALQKLQAMDRLMSRLRGVSPRQRRWEAVTPLGGIKQTLRSHYSQRQRRFLPSRIASIDRELKKVFGGPSGNLSPFRKQSAAAFLRTIHKDTSRRIARKTQTYQYAVHQVVGDLIDRTSQLGLRLTKSSRTSETEFVSLVENRLPEFLECGRTLVSL